ncbi:MULTISPECIES: hypothetical protein [Burkholderia]|jgi:hypothetical protein|uniref:hypothetical protein n=1 Tax=Burkholderia TaxID=32008 RepID=UPI0011B24994|nr:hypothetical protein [Burkholderia ambifaria]
MYSSSLGMFLFKKPPMAEPITKFRQSVLRCVNSPGPARLSQYAAGNAIVESRMASARNTGRVALERAARRLGGDLLATGAAPLHGRGSMARMIAVPIPRV